MQNFASIPVTTLAILTYGLVFLAVFVTDQTPSVSVNQEGLNLDAAIADLDAVRLLVFVVHFE